MTRSIEPVGIPNCPIRPRKSFISKFLAPTVDKALGKGFIEYVVPMELRPEDGPAGRYSE